MIKEQYFMIGVGGGSAPPVVVIRKLAGTPWRDVMKALKKLTREHYNGGRAVAWSDLFVWGIDAWPEAEHPAMWERWRGRADRHRWEIGAGGTFRRVE